MRLAAPDLSILLSSFMSFSILLIVHSILFLSTWLNVSIYLSIYLSSYLSIHPSIYRPTDQPWLSDDNIFKILIITTDVIIITPHSSIHVTSTRCTSYVVFSHCKKWGLILVLLLWSTWSSALRNQSIGQPKHQVGAIKWSTYYYFSFWDIVCSE